MEGPELLFMLRFYASYSLFQIWDMSSGGKSSTATNRVLSMFQEWDNGTKASRARMLEDFVSTNESQTGPELELEFAQAASLFFARITAWMRLR